MTLRVESVRSMEMKFLTLGYPDEWIGRGGQAAQWISNPQYFEVAPGRGDIQTRKEFRDFDLHLEFWLPKMENAQGQDRANSGVYLQGRYEIQILDSYQ